MNIDVTKMPKECQCCKGTGVAVDNFQSKIIWLRGEVGVSQQEMADKLGINRATIANMENGRHQASPETLVMLHKILGVSIYWLLGVEDG